jgi:iron complex outermembrane recepter protein
MSESNKFRKNLPFMGFWVFSIFCLLMSIPANVRADAAPEPKESEIDLTAVGIEDLMDLTVTSVSRKEQKLYNAAAAVFVITQEDIRRSGVTSIPDALRMVPGLEVARIDSNKWAISSRGFNGRFASKMLVLMDGRTVYTPLFSGVFWDEQDTLMEDIERIEIIRGPGATMWGANAVNGIINIITKQADDTIGGLVTAGGGTLERVFGSARYGTSVGNDTNLRLYLKYQGRGGLQDQQTGREEHNGWNALRGGFRMDSQPTDNNTLTLQGDYYDERLNETYLNTVPGNASFDYTTPASGGNLLSRWKHTFSDTADMALQLYYDRTEKKFAVIDAKYDTVDLDFQNRFAASKSQEVIWGAGYRFTHDRLNFPLPGLAFSKTTEGDNLFSAFLQDNITLVPDRLHLIVGSKFEHNDYTGFESQPNARLLWTPTQKQSVWMSVSRAVRTPSRGEEYLSLAMQGEPVTVPTQGGPLTLPSQVKLLGSTALNAEELVAYELGYRVEPVERITFDLAAFYNVYRRLDIYKQGDSSIDFASPQPSVTTSMQLGNFGRAQTCGVELAADYKALPWWRVRMAYTFLDLVKEETDPGASLADLKGANPRHQVSLRSSMDVTKKVELDLWMRYVSALQLGEMPAVDISSYLTLDARLAWKPVNDVELSLVGQNLLQERHTEFLPQFINTQPAAVGRSVYAKISWKF